MLSFLMNCYTLVLILSDICDVTISHVAWSLYFVTLLIMGLGHIAVGPWFFNQLLCTSSDHCIGSKNSLTTVVIFLKWINSVLSSCSLCFLGISVLEIAYFCFLLIIKLDIFFLWERFLVLINTSHIVWIDCFYYP